MPSHSSLQSRRSAVFDSIQFLALIAALAWFTRASVEQTGYHWQWYRIPHYLGSFGETGFTAGPLLTGLGITFMISAISLVFALLIGLTTALLRLYGSPVASLLARLYLEISRNTPLLIQIFFIYFVLGPVLGLERLPAAILALSLFEGAYAAEIFRAGIQSVPKEQREAAAALGLTAVQTYRHIILPQAVRVVLPPLTGQMVSLIKDSALVSTVAIYDLTMQAQAIIAETYLTFEIWFTVALMYLIVTGSLSLLASFLERRLRIQ